MIFGNYRIEGGDGLLVMLTRENLDRLAAGEPIRLEFRNGMTRPADLQLHFRETIEEAKAAIDAVPTSDDCIEDRSSPQALNPHPTVIPPDETGHP